MGRLNFVKLLKKRGYEEDIIRRADKSIFCKNYQKLVYKSPEGTPEEFKEEIWNAITIFNSKMMSAASPTELVLENVPLPVNRGEAERILTMIEKYDKPEQHSQEDQKIDSGENRDSGSEAK